MHCLVADPFEDPSFTVKSFLKMRLDICFDSFSLSELPPMKGSWGRRGNGLLYCMVNYEGLLHFFHRYLFGLYVYVGQ